MSFRIDFQPKEFTDWREKRHRAKLNLVENKGWWGDDDVAFSRLHIQYDYAFECTDRLVLLQKKYLSATGKLDPTLMEMITPLLAVEHAKRAELLHRLSEPY